MKSLLKFVAVVFCCLLYGWVTEACGTERPFGPLELRSQSPLQQLRCGPIHHVPWVLPDGGRILSISHTWKNFWLLNDDAFLIDAELHEIAAQLRIGLGNRLELTGEIPIRFASGGVLDGLIENFHRMLGIGNAGRDGYPRDAFAFKLHTGTGDDDWSIAGDEHQGWHLGNATVAASYDLGKPFSASAGVVLTVGMKLPTGTRTAFFGGQSVDYTLSLSTGLKARPLYFYLSSAATYYGDDDMVGVRIRQLHFSSLIGVEYNRENSAHAWTAQLLTESGVARDFYDFSNETYELTFAYRRHLSEALSLDIGLLENIFAFDNSPDVGVHSALHYRFPVKGQ